MYKPTYNTSNYKFSPVKHTPLKNKVTIQANHWPEREADIKKALANITTIKTELGYTPPPKILKTISKQPINGYNKAGLKASFFPA